MSYLKKIVEYIDAAVRETIICDNSLLAGLAQTLPRYDKDKVQLFPSYVDNEGEARYVGPDDEFDFITYHRVLSIAAGKGNVNQTFGNDKTFDTHIARMVMVVFGRRDKMRKSSDEVATYLHAAVPDGLTKELRVELKFSASNINVKEIILNDMQVFNEEFANVPFFIKPEQFLFKVNYTIESAFLKRCFNKCSC